MSPRYVSPSTKSITIAAYGKPGNALLVRKSTNLRRGVKGCRASATGLTCTFTFPVPAGKARLDVTTYDELNEKGHKLAALLNFPLIVKVGKTVKLPLSLGGLAESIAVIPPGGQAVTGTQAGGFSIVGNLPQTFTIVTQDADGNYIVGAGSPRMAITAVPSNAAIVQASATTWTLTSSFTSATNPTTPATTAFSVRAKPAAHSGGKAIQTSIPLALYQPWIYVANYQNGTITAYDEAGNPKTLTGSFAGLMNQPYYLAYAPSSGWLYVTGYGSGILAYDVMGNAQSPSGGFPNVDSPGQLAFDPHNNLMYVPNTSATTTNYVTAYDPNGNQETLSGSAFTGMENGAWLMAYDPNSNDLYAANFNSNIVAGYTESGSGVTPVGGFPNIDQPFGLAFDSSNGYVYVSNHGSLRAITVYDAQGNQLSVSGGFGGITYPYGIAYDPYNDRLYVANVYSSPGNVFEYDGEGNQQPLPGGAFSGVNYPYGIAVVP